ncbi:MAG TPA: DNA-formamidopyrimidine glycosylase family protein [Acidimicrobiia bacterium]|nr:DNA-formamidopyrimidine glycosylase family protein [Acidimicrobiia bacterium]
MPDGSHAHRVAREHHALVGRVVDVRAGACRHRAIAAACTGRVLHAVDAIGKHLFYRFDDATILHVHFGVRGTARRVDPAQPLGTDVALRLHSGDLAWELLHPHRCELVTAARETSVRAQLGPDPLGPSENGERAWRRVHATDEPLAAVLLDQTIVSGVGSEVANEALHTARLHPLTPATAVRRDEFDLLWREIARRMQRDVNAPDLDVPPDERSVGRPRVYRRKRCRRCGKPVLRARVRQRTAYFCPQCQQARVPRATTRR